MRSSLIHCITLAIVSLTRAQNCGGIIADFENLTEVTSLSTTEGKKPIPNGYAGLNWANLFAAAIDSPATTPVVISTTPGRTISPKSIFLGTVERAMPLGGFAALAGASSIVVTATFLNGTTAQTIFNFKPPNEIWGVGIIAEAMQNVQFPCGWTKVVSLSFRPHAENGVDDLLGMAIDNVEYKEDTAA